MKSQLSLWKVLAHDMGERCSVDTTRDVETVTRRVEHEGDHFLTITLPSFGKAFERWLENGWIDPAMTPSFKSRGGVPLFLGGLLGLVFSPEGVILRTEDIDVDAILAIRQLCGVFGKMHELASPDRVRDAMLQYLETDQELADIQQRCKEPDEDFLDLRRMFAMLYGGVLDRINRKIALAEPLHPKHGPGSTADGLLGNKKFMMEWTWRLEEYFPSSDYLIPNFRYHQMLEGVRFRTPEDESPVKVISVPKTAKTPRIIAMEPACMQYAQQAVSGILVKSIEAEYILKRLIGFSDQEPNQVLAREGSLFGTLATLDLSEASDRVTNDLVRFLFGRWQHLDGAIQACRSYRAEVRVDDDTLVQRELVKFASMGSALTFPIEAMTFLAIVFLGIERNYGRRLLVSDISRMIGMVRVYGDDIVVPTNHVRSVVHVLESFGFKVNSDKSFWSGSFRESCGKDYFSGVDVSYIKFRKRFPDDRRSVEEIVSLVSFFNQAKDMGYTHTVDALRKELKDLFGGFFPRVSRESAILGEWDDITHDIDRLCSQRHVPLSKGYVVKAHIPVNPLDGERALLKFFLKEGLKPLEREHLQRSGRSSAVSIKLRRSPT